MHDIRLKVNDFGKGYFCYCRHRKKMIMPNLFISKMNLLSCNSEILLNLKEDNFWYFYVLLWQYMWSKTIFNIFMSLLLRQYIRSKVNYLYLSQLSTIKHCLWSENKEIIRNIYLW